MMGGTQFFSYISLFPFFTKLFKLSDKFNFCKQPFSKFSDSLFKLFFFLIIVKIKDLFHKTSCLPPRGEMFQQRGFSHTFFTAYQKQFGFQKQSLNFMYFKIPTAKSFMGKDTPWFKPIFVSSSVKITPDKFCFLALPDYRQYPIIEIKG